MASVLVNGSVIETDPQNRIKKDGDVRMYWGRQCNCGRRCNQCRIGKCSIHKDDRRGFFPLTQYRIVDRRVRVRITYHSGVNLGPPEG